MLFQKQKRKSRLDHYRIKIAPTLEAFGFEAQRVISDDMGTLDATHHLEHMDVWLNHPGLLRGYAISYGHLINGMHRDPEHTENSYRMTFSARITTSMQMGKLSLHVDHPDGGKFGESGKDLLQAVAPITYFSGERLVALFARAFTSIEEVEESGDSDTIWLVALLSDISELGVRMMCDLPVLHPQQKTASSYLISEAKRLFADGYAI